MDAGDESEQARLVGLDDRVRRRRELVGTLEELDVDKEVLDDLGFGLVYELVSSESRTAGGDQVVDDDDVGAGGEGVLLHLEDVRAVLLLVLCLEALSGQFPLLPH